jgi:general secretion pathway protein G
MRARERNAVVRGGFTLMEMLVVVAILVVLAGAAVPIYMNYLETSKRQIAWANAKTLEQTADAFRLDQGDYPSSLEQLIQPPNGRPPYVEPRALLDPWEHEYQYANPGQHSTTGKPDIWSLGPKMGDPNGMIGNWLTKP